MGFFSSVSLMVRLGVFKRIRDVHSPSGWLYSASWRWIGPSYYRSQRHWFWLGPRGVGQRSKALCDGAVYARQFQCAYRSNNIVFFVLSSYFLYFCFVPFQLHATPGNDAPPQERPKGRSSQTDDPRSFRRFGAGYISSRLERLWQCHSGKCAKSSAGY
jgi:hypothetical protein